MRTLSSIWLFAALLWSLLLTWGSLTDNPPQAPAGLSSDKILHLLAYLILTLLLGFGLKNSSLRRRPWLLAGCLAFFCGGLLEWLQPLLSQSRVAEGGDLLANGIGVMIGCCAGLLSSRKRMGEDGG